MLVHPLHTSRSDECVPVRPCQMPSATSCLLYPPMWCIWGVFLAVPLWPFLLPSINVLCGPCMEMSWSGTIGWPGDPGGYILWRIYTLSLSIYIYTLTGYIPFPAEILRAPNLCLFLPLSCNQKWGLAARWSKASKEASLVESLLYFRCWQLERGRADSYPKVDSLPCPRHPQWQPVDKGFYR